MPVLVMTVIVSGSPLRLTYPRRPPCWQCEISNRATYLSCVDYDYSLVNCSTFLYQAWQDHVGVTNMENLPFLWAHSPMQWIWTPVLLIGTPIKGLASQLFVPMSRQVFSTPRSFQCSAVGFAAMHVSSTASVTYASWPGINLYWIHDRT